MAGLNIDEIKLIRERIIVTIKRNGELTDSGHRMHYTEFQPALLKDEIVSSVTKLKNADYSPQSILSYFDGQKDVKIIFQKDPPKHWIQFALKRVIKSKEIIEAARKTIQDIKTRNGVNIDEEFHISKKELTAEFSRTIPFFELYLKSNKMSLKDFLKDLDLNGLKEDTSSKTDKTGETVEKKQGKEQKESVAEGPKEALDIVRKEILSIFEQQGAASSGYRQMVLGALCNTLADNSEAYQTARSTYKGPARSFLLDCFGDLLTIEYIDGKDWVRISQSAFDKKKDRQKNEKTKEKLVSANETVPAAESLSPIESVKSVKESKTVKTSKTTVKKKETAKELLIQGLVNLSDKELDQLLHIIGLVYDASGSTLIKTTKKKTELAVDKNATSSIVEVIEKVGLNAQAVLAKNEIMNKITTTLTTGETIETINEEIIKRKGEPDEQEEAASIERQKGAGGATPQHKTEIMTETDYQGLDEWLPF